MKTEFIANEIPLDIAIQAHSGTSFVPDERGKRDLRIYQNILETDFKEISDALGEEDFSEFWESYIEKLRSRYIAYLSALSRCVSTMITGPANFDVRRAMKANHSAHKRWEEIDEYRRNAKEKFLRKKLDIGPILSNDPRAIEKLDAELSEAVALHEKMKEVNRIIRLGDENVLRERGIDPESDFSSGYRLSNSRARIKRIEQRISNLKRNRATPESEYDVNGIRVKDNLIADRVQIFFPGKPDAQMRSRLKSYGFRWAPSIGAWQGYRNARTKSAVKEIFGVSF